VLNSTAIEVGVRVDMVQQAVKSDPQVEQQEALCLHHWAIEASTGPVSRGTCGQCGAEREFKNYIDATLWWEESSDVQDGIIDSATVSNETAEEPEGS
jgi:hypothetical protein